MSRKKEKKARSKSARQESKPAPPRDGLHDFADNLIFSGTLLTAFLRPFISGRTYPVFNHFFNIAIAILAVLWIMKAWRKGTLVLHNRLLTVFVLGFLLICSFTFFTTVNKGITLRYVYEILAYSLLFLVIANNFRERSSIHALVVVLIAAGILVNSYGLGQLFYTLPMTREYVEQALSAADGGALEGIPIGSGVLHRLETSRIFSFFLHPNSYAMYLGILGAITAGWIWSMRESLHRFAAESAGRIFRKSSASGNPDKRASSLLSILTGAGGVILLALLLASCILIPLCLWLTYSRGGLLSALAAAGAFLVSALWRKKAPKEALAAVILVVLVITLFQGQTAFSADNIEVRDVSFIGRLKDPQTVAQRLSYWKTALAMIADNPWFGVGWGAFESAYPRYMVLGGYPVRLAHNNYLQVWAETGLLGLNLFVGILLVALYTFWRKSRSFSAGAMRGMACGLGAGIVGFMVNSLVDFALYLPSLCFFVFTCLGLLAAIPGDDENDKFSIPLKVPSAIVLQVALVAFIILLFRSCIALRLYETVEKQASSAFPNAFSRERGFRSDPQFQYRVLKESVPQLKKSISYFSFSSDSHMMLGNTYLRLAALEQAPHLIREAIGHLNRAAELNSLSPYIQQLLAQAYWKEGAAANQTGSFQKALRAEQKASNNFPVHPAFHKELADIYTALGNVEQAQQEAARAAELSKHYREF